MNAAKSLSTDTRVSGKVADRVIGMLRGIVDDANSVDELVNRIEETTGSDGQTQFIVCHALTNLAEEAGKYRGGEPTLADSILDQQAAKVKRYGKSAYRLSEKQVAVIASDAWRWLRPEMRQGK